MPALSMLLPVVVIVAVAWSIRNRNAREEVGRWTNVPEVRPPPDRSNRIS
jgi:hypothetical protein